MCGKSILASDIEFKCNYNVNIIKEHNALQWGDKYLVLGGKGWCRNGFGYQQD